MKEYFIDTYNFQHWRIKQYHKHLERLDAGFFDKFIPGSLPTLRALIRHIVWVDGLWHSRIDGKSYMAETDFPAADIAELFGKWERYSTQWLQRINDANPEDFEKVIKFQSTSGDSYTNTLRGILIHIADHRAYHSGQLVAGLRMPGVAVIPTSYPFEYASSMSH